jgi:cation:H+ antiporter
MVAVSAMCLPIFFGGYDISRIDGGFLFAYYLVYTTYLIMTAGHHAALPAFRIIFGWVLIPASVIFLLWVALAGWQRDRRRARAGEPANESYDNGD